MRRLAVTVSFAVVLGFAGVSDAQTCLGNGVSAAGGCWFLGALNESCNAVCGDVGALYDEITSNFAGSNGADVGCNVVLNALGVAGSGVVATSCNTGGVGCNFVPSGPVRARCTMPATDSSAADPTVQRACACRASVHAAAPAMNGMGMIAALSVLLGIAAYRLRAPCKS